MQARWKEGQDMSHTARTVTFPSPKNFPAARLESSTTPGPVPCPPSLPWDPRAALCKILQASGSQLLLEEQGLRSPEPALFHSILPCWVLHS